MFTVRGKAKSGTPAKRKRKIIKVTINNQKGMHEHLKTHNNEVMEKVEKQKVAHEARKGKIKSRRR